MSEDGEPAKNSKTQWTKIGAGVAGGVLLALQGVNLGEVIGTSELIKRTDKAIDQQTELIKEINAESKRIEIGLENQQTIINNQTEILKHLQQNPNQ